MAGEVNTADVLVVGGGIAGGLAAIRAAEAGAEVTLMEKTNLRRSGSIASGIDHLAAVFPGESLDDYINDCIWTTDGFVITDTMRAVASRTYEAMRMLEDWGIPFKNPERGDYIRIRGMAASHAWSIHFEGHEIKPVLDREIRKRGINVIERVMATDLLVNGGHAGGVTGINIRTGEQVVAEAKATVLATGGVGNRLYGTTTGNPFHTFTLPLDTADGQMMALRAGAEVMERVLGLTLIPKDFPSPGLSNFIGYKCHLVNGLGERIMERYDPENMENAMRAQLVRAVLTENMEGRGPCFMDCRHLPEETIELIYRGIANEKPPLIEYLKKRDIDLKKDMFEVQAFGLHGRRNGPLVNERMETSIPGLYASGDCAGFGSGVSGGGESAASGLIAGDCAAEYSAGAEPPVTDEKQVAENLELIEKYGEEGSIKPMEFEAKLARTMSDYVGHTRNRSGLLVAQKRLGLLKGDLEKISAENPRELWWAFESRNLFEIARLVTFFALEREESRSYHLRADFPEKDDEKWGKIMIARLDGNDIRYRTIPMPTRG